MLYELPALRDDSWNEDEPVSGVRIDTSPGKPDFFDASPGTATSQQQQQLKLLLQQQLCCTL